MFKLDALSEQYTTACFDRTREAHFNREVQRREDVLLKEREDWTLYAVSVQGDCKGRGEESYTDSTGRPEKQQVRFGPDRR